MFIPVIDVKSAQYSHLIYRRLTEINVQSKLLPVETTLNDIIKMRADAVILSGGPPRIFESLGELSNLIEIVLNFESPILGICVSHQLIACAFGGKAGPAKTPEYGPVVIYIDDKNEIFEGFNNQFIAWASHNDEVYTPLPRELKVLAHSENCEVQALKHLSRPVYGVQFHPEVSHTENGLEIFRNFTSLVKA